MNFYKILDKIFILLLIIFIICCSKMAVADEKPIRNAIGCVLPLSGQYAAWGHKALDAILLSAKIFDKENKTLWEVLVEDSAGLPEKTKAAIARLANDKN